MLMKYFQMFQNIPDFMNVPNAFWGQMLLLRITMITNILSLMRNGKKSGKID